MKLSRAFHIYFSPTHTTKMITEAVIKGLGSEDISLCDLTRGEAGELPAAESNDIAVIGMPVYAGRLPDLALARFKPVRGNGAAAVVIAVYGNRDFDDALLELKQIATDQGFRVIAAGAFIGEHSFSSEAVPIAVNRPHRIDLLMAEELGQNVGQFITRGDADPADLRVPGNFPYKEKHPSLNVAPETSKALCTKCLKCVSACPSHAIDKDSPFITDAVLCIRCAACIKICPSDARAFTDQRLLEKARQLSAMCSEPKLPEVFYSN